MVEQSNLRRENKVLVPLLIRLETYLPVPPTPAGVLGDEAFPSTQITGYYANTILADLSTNFTGMSLTWLIDHNDIYICHNFECIIAVSIPARSSILLLIHPVWVLGLGIDPLRLLAGCRKTRLNQAPLNLRGLIWLLMTVWSKRGNINTAALVTIAQCNTLVARCSRQLIGPADWVFVTLGPLRCD